MSDTLTEPEAEVRRPEPEPDPEPEPGEGEPQPEPEPEPEPEPQPQPEQTVDPVAMEKALRKVDQSATTYRNRVGDLLGDAIHGFTTCPLCADGVMGFIPPLEDAEPSSELQARLLDVLKQPRSPDFQPAPNARRCGTCDGWGQVLSGSRVAGKERIVCPTCRGNGFQGGEVAPAPTNEGNGTVEFPPPPGEGPVATGDVDIWGSPRLLDDGQENPNYGKMVQYKNPELP